MSRKNRHPFVLKTDEHLTEAGSIWKIPPQKTNMTGIREGKVDILLGLMMFPFLFETPMP